MKFVTTLGCFALCVIAGLSDASAGDARHYVFFNRDRERIADATFLATKAIEGAQLKYTWRELERGIDGYEFSDIRHDLSFLASKGKKLFIQIQDVSFDPAIVNVPRYLLNIFWSTQEPFYSEKLIPLLQTQP